MHPKSDLAIIDGRSRGLFGLESFYIQLEEY